MSSDAAPSQICFQYLGSLRWSTGTSGALAGIKSCFGISISYISITCRFGANFGLDINSKAISQNLLVRLVQNGTKLISRYIWSNATNWKNSVLLRAEYFNFVIELLLCMDWTAPVCVEPTLCGPTWCGRVGQRSPSLTYLTFAKWN